MSYSYFNDDWGLVPEPSSTDDIIVLHLEEKVVNLPQLDQYKNLRCVTFKNEHNVIDIFNMVRDHQSLRSIRYNVEGGENDAKLLQQMLKYYNIRVVFFGILADKLPESNTGKRRAEQGGRVTKKEKLPVVAGRKRRVSFDDDDDLVSTFKRRVSFDDDDDLVSTIKKMHL